MTMHGEILILHMIFKLVVGAVETGEFAAKRVLEAIGKNKGIQVQSKL